MDSGIYIIKNILNDKIYVGSSINIKKRFQEHRIHLKKRKHTNAHLQKSWDLHGEENFVFVELEYCDKTLLLEREQAWIDYYKSHKTEDNIYNICQTAGNTLGRKHTKEAKEKISKNHSDVSGENNPMFGKPSPNTGVKMPEERRQKISNALKGKKSWNKGLNKLNNDSLKKRAENILGENNPFYGKQHRDETKEKIKQSRKSSNANLLKAKLDWEKVHQIRKMKEDGLSNRKLGLLFGVSSTTIYSIVHHIMWKEE